MQEQRATSFDPRAARRRDGATVLSIVPNHQRILGCRVDPLSMAESVDAIVDQAAGDDRGAYVCLTNAFATVEARRSRDLSEAVERSFLSVPDGMPLVWMLKQRGFEATQKVTGIELMPLVATAGLEHGLRHFFFGGAPGVADAAAARLAAMVPGVQIAGTMCPPFDPNGAWDVDDVNRALRDTEADIMWVGVGAPKQELWMAQASDRIHVPVMLGVGAAFDFLAGTKRAAPRTMSALGLEWLFRLLSEPKRLWRRYLVGNSTFLYLLVTHSLRG